MRRRCVTHSAPRGNSGCRRTMRLAGKRVVLPARDCSSPRGETFRRGRQAPCRGEVRAAAPRRRVTAFRTKAPLEESCRDGGTASRARRGFVAVLKGARRRKGAARPRPECHHHVSARPLVALVFGLPRSLSACRACGLVAAITGPVAALAAVIRRGRNYMPRYAAVRRVVRASRRDPNRWWVL